jgi:hypothetical protein
MSFSNEVRVMLDGSLIDYSRPNHANSKYSSIDHSPLDDLTHPSASMAPADSDGRLIDRSLRLADDQEVVRQMAYVLRSWPRARGRRRGDEALARVTAERLIDYLHLSGFELMKRPVATDTGYVGGAS